DRVRTINLAAVALARRALAESRSPAYIAGSIGPIGTAFPAAVAAVAFREQAEALRDGGVDLLMVETITALTEMRVALAAIRAVCDLPIVATMAFDPDLRTVDGADPATAARAMRDWGAAVIGANCGHGPAHIARVIAAMQGACDLPLAAQPSAGLPEL